MYTLRYLSTHVTVLSSGIYWGAKYSLTCSALFLKISTLLMYFFVDDSQASQRGRDGLSVLLVFGEMDTQGEIFNDCLVLMPKIEN